MDQGTDQDTDQDTDQGTDRLGWCRRGASRLTAGRPGTSWFRHIGPLHVIFRLQHRAFVSIGLVNTLGAYVTAWGWWWRRIRQRAVARVAPAARVSGDKPGMGGRRSARIRLFARVAIAAAAAMPMSGCSAPGLFPAVLTTPAPRDDTMLTSAQIKQATENLISERDHLCTEAMAGEDANGSPTAVSNCGAGNVETTGSTAKAGAGVKP